jgi:hypothetical protein
MKNNPIYLRPTPVLSKEATAEILATLDNPGKPSEALRKQFEHARALKKALTQKKSQSKLPALLK